jgi:hypothetical protein
MSDIDRIVGWLLGRDPRATPTKARLETLLARYAEKGLKDALGGAPREGPSGGECLAIESFLPVSLSFPDVRSAKEAFLSELRLLFGIGCARDHDLRQEGYKSIPSLLGHPRWCEAAASLIEDWGSPLDAERVHETLSTWLPTSHPLFLQLLALVSPAEALFLDLETLGLGGAPVFLAALGRPEGDGIHVTQYLARSLEEEVPLLEQVGAEIAVSSILLTYNGKAFDWTTLVERSAYYGVSLPRPPVHVDLLHHARRAFRDRLNDVRLGTVEAELLHVRRLDDLPSEDVPEHYATYLETGNPGPLVPVVRHNRQDVGSLALLLSRLLWQADHGR